MPLRLSRFGRRSRGRRFGSRRRGYKKFPRKSSRYSFRKRRNYNRKRRFGHSRRRYQGKLMGTYNRTFPTYTSIGGKNSVSIRGRECLGSVRSMNTSGLYTPDDNDGWPAYVPDNANLMNASGKIYAGLQGYAITCRNGTLLSKLSDYSKLYDKYYVKSITFQYIPAVSTQTPGNVFMYWEPNPIQPPVGKWSGKESFPSLFARNATNSFTQVFGPMQMKVPIARKWNYTYSSQLGVDRFCDYGYLWVYCSHNTGTDKSIGVGTLYCSYDIVLKFPSIPHDIAGTSVAVNRTAPVSSSAESSALPISASVLELEDETVTPFEEKEESLLEKVRVTSLSEASSDFINNHRSQVWNFESEEAMSNAVSVYLERMRKYVDDIRPDLTPLMVLSSVTTPRSASVRIKPLCFVENASDKYQSPLINYNGFTPDTKTYWDLYGSIYLATMDGLMLKTLSYGPPPSYEVEMVYNLDDVVGAQVVSGEFVVNTNVQSSVSTRCVCSDSGPFVKVVLDRSPILTSDATVMEHKLNVGSGVIEMVEVIDPVQFGFWSSLLGKGTAPGNSLYCIPMKTMKFKYPGTDRNHNRRILYRYRFLDGYGISGWTSITKEAGQLYKDFDREGIAAHGPVIDFTFICVGQLSQESWAPCECSCVVFAGSDHIMNVDDLLA